MTDSTTRPPHIADELTVLLQALRAHVRRSGCGECERRCNEMIDRIGEGEIVERHRG